MSSSEYLNYESGKFSKSKGVGVFGSDAMETGIPSDVWRFYIYYNRPEKSDALFTWDDFQIRVNSELIGNLGNLINRTLTFLYKFYEGKIPDSPGNEEFRKTIFEREEEITRHLDRAELKDALKKILALSSIANKAFQDGEPWKTRTTDPDKADALLFDLVYTVKDLAVLISPFLPETSRRVASFLNLENLSWDMLGQREGLKKIQKPEILFTPLEDPQISELRNKFSGTQKERAMESEKQEQEKIKEQISPEDAFRTSVDLRAAVITDVERHPEADKLYIETVSLG